MIEQKQKKHLATNKWQGAFLMPVKESGNYRNLYTGPKKKKEVIKDKRQPEKCLPPAGIHEGGSFLQMQYKDMVPGRKAAGYPG